MTQIDQRLGKFSISLAVKSLQASREFYQKLGFEPVAGDGKIWQVLKNGDVTLGIIQGMFERNILTFNPGWDSQRKALSSFVDVRELHARAKAAGLETTREAGLDGAGPGSFMLTDPDGNPVLIDQHV
jgi:predicted lactoylglutathione lyase